ncbi:MAG: hypothetical protein QOE55_4180, partial [Acidobacteriaceae bacterium]|nr:hypothetical protein [Acidobacteriaceae bacterium]
RSLDAKLIPKIDAFVAHRRHLLIVNGMGHHDNQSLDRKA